MMSKDVREMWSEITPAASHVKQGRLKRRKLSNPSTEKSLYLNPYDSGWLVCVFKKN
jgi:hypothetical protein